MQEHPEERLSGLDEAGLLARILPSLPTTPTTLLGPGDDAAVVAAPDGRVVVTTDMLVEGRDFRREWSEGADVGWKAAAQNLSDVAAMGAVPTALVVGLAAPADLPVAWAEGLARGLAEACEGTGASVVGGDLSAAGEVVVSVTALGDLQSRPPVRRDGARPGDVVAVAGTLGRAAAGLWLLERGREHDGPDLVAVQRRPRPPLASGPAAAAAGATAMIDVSDGLLLDLQRVADASGVTVDLDGEEVDRRAGLLVSAGGGDTALARIWVLTGGEDYPLAACFPGAGGLPEGFRPVGRVREREASGGVLVDGAPPSVDGRGWDHFSR